MWNRDLARSAHETRAIERAEGMTDKGRCAGTVGFPDLRAGEIGLIIATLIARKNHGENSDIDFRTHEIAHAQAQGQLAYYQELERQGIIRLIRTSRDLGAWTIPKGLVAPGEPLLAAARREFQEETGIVPQEPFIPLGSVRQKAGKIIHAWAWEGDADPTTIVSNTMQYEWPRGSGRWVDFPEVDRCAWFSPDAARSRLNPAQAELIDRLRAALASA